MAESRRKAGAEIRLSSFEDLFGTTQESTNHRREEVVEVNLKELHSFKNHPFRVIEDEKMEETVDSIQKYGVLMPGIVRPRKEGGYEIIAGHRRKHASELAGKTTMPVFVRDYSDDEAVVVMVDTNIQREDILPSEKAKAYRMKFEARKHQGSKDGKRTLDEIGELAGESGKTVQRYIWLSRLNDELLEMVDKKKLGIVQGIDISFLTEEEQLWVTNELSVASSNLTGEQSIILKKYSKSGTLTKMLVKDIIGNKSREKRGNSINWSRIRTYFPSEYDEQEMENIICRLLEGWKQRESIGHDVQRQEEEV